LRNQLSCRQSLRLRIGDRKLRLNFLATGGVFIGGSIAAKIVPRMQHSVFMESFLDKGRMRALLADIPVKIILNDNCGITGAARYTLIQKAFKSRIRVSA
jgi:glucokinase